MIGNLLLDAGRGTGKEAAANVWGYMYNEQSITEKTEFGSAIYKTKVFGEDVYSFTDPLKADKDPKTWTEKHWFNNIEDMVPKGSEMVAKIHPHGNYDPDYDDKGASWDPYFPGIENFSQRDKTSQGLETGQINYYLATPGGRLKKMAFDSQGYSNTICPCLPYDETSSDHINPEQIRKTTIDVRPIVFMPGDTEKRSKKKPSKTYELKIIY
ncbi:MAG: DUF4329 domain-containing protein [Bacteroidota bacterium]